MGVPLNLKDIQSGFLSASAFNANNSLIEEALAKAVNRTSNAEGNAMEVDLDLGLNNINNLKAAVFNHQGVPLLQVNDIIRASASDITSTVDVEYFTATEGQTAINFQSIEYITDVFALMVFKNGIYQRTGFEYTETSTTSISFNDPLTAGDEIVVMGARFDATVFANQASEDATTAEDAAQEAENSAQEAKDAAGYKLGINNQAGITYTLVEADEGDLIRMSNAAENTVIIPNDNIIDFEIGTIVLVRQIGAGQTTVEGDTGVTVNAPNGDNTIQEEDFGVGVVKVDVNTWDMVKSYSAVPAEALTALEEYFQQQLDDALASFGNETTDIGSQLDAFEDQINSTIDNFNAQFNSSKTVEGFQDLPGGLRIQWGLAQPPALTPEAYQHSFAYPFDNQCFAVMLTQEESVVDSDTNLIVTDKNSSSFTYKGPTIGDALSERQVRARFIAIGY